MITTEERVGQITIQPSGHLEVERVIILSEDGKEIGRVSNKRIIPPDADLERDDSRPARIAKADREARAKAALER